MYKQSAVQKKIHSLFHIDEISRIYHLLSPFLKKQKRVYLILLLFMGFDIFLTLAFAWFYGAVTNAALKGNFTLLKEMIPIGLPLLGLNLLSYFFGLYTETYASQVTKMDLKNFLFHHLLRLPASNLNERRAGELISHFSTDIHSVDGFLGNSLIALIRLPLFYICVLIYLLHLSWPLCVTGLCLSPLALLASFIFGRILRRNGNKIFKLYGSFNNVLDETFHGLSVIRSFTLEKKFYKTFQKKNQELLDLELESAKLQGYFYTGSQFAGTLTFLVSLSLGAYLISKGNLTVGSLITFINLVHYLTSPLTGMASQWAGFQKAISAIDRVLDVLETPPVSDTLPEFTPSGMGMDQHIEFQNVTFSYSEDQALFNQFNLFIPSGKRVAFVGPSGAGKTTLFNLLQGIYTPQAGQVLIGDRPIDSYSLSELRSAIAIVPQETFLFAGTIRENLLLARPGITEEEMIQAAELAQLHSFIHSLPKGYETEIGERGVKLSGGQRQRLAIARAILKNSPILLLDEATSALDTQTEVHIQKALEALMKDRTTLVIAHRLSTIQNADLIVVIDQGQIVQMGSHQELMSHPGLYKTMNETVYEETELSRVLAQ